MISSHAKSATVKTNQFWSMIKNSTAVVVEAFCTKTMSGP
jgi:hypothetical protein